MIDLRELEINELTEFEDSPFQFREDTAFELLVDSIKTLGVLTPIIVRPTEEGNFEIISGHRRVEACKRLDIETIPAIVKELTKDEAVIMHVDSNLQRDSILPSEKAYGYKMKLEAMKRQGFRSDLTSDQVGEKLTSVENVASESPDSKTQVQRFIRLTYLIEPLLKLVDENRIALTPAVALSFLHPPEQQEVYAFYENNEITPSYAQAVKMKKLSAEGKLNCEKISDIMSETKGNQKEFFKIPSERIDPYFDDRVSDRKRQEIIIRALDYYSKHLERIRKNRGAR